MKMIPAFAAVAVLLVGCASGPQRGDGAGAPATTAAAGDTKAVKSVDGSFVGEVVGTPVRGGKFARLKIGMSMTETQNLLGRAPDRLHTYESGKRWIPFYFGNDATRMQVLYKGDGCLIFTGGNVWGAAGGDLIRIENDASGACYQP